jgi:hypothetical protein
MVVASCMEIPCATKKNDHILVILFQQTLNVGTTVANMDGWDQVGVFCVKIMKKILLIYLLIVLCSSGPGIIGK